MWKFPPLTYSYVEAGVRGHACLYNPRITMQPPNPALKLFWNSRSSPPARTLPSGIHRHAPSSQQVLCCPPHTTVGARYEATCWTDQLDMHWKDLTPCDVNLSWRLLICKINAEGAAAVWEEFLKAEKIWECARRGIWCAAITLNGSVAWLLLLSLQIMQYGFCVYVWY